MLRGRANVLIAGGVLLASAVVWFASLGAAPRQVPRRTATSTSAGVAARQKIKHVVLIVQENRTFDNLFGGYANAPADGPRPYPGADATFPPEVVGKMRPAGFDSPSTPRDASHDAFACLNQQSWVEDAPRRFSTQRWIDVATRPPNTCPNAGAFFLYVPTKQRAVYWEIANAYGLGDRFFAATSSASFPPHQFIVAGDVSVPTTAGRVGHISEDPGTNCFNPPAQQNVQIVGPNVFSVTAHVDGPGGCYDRPTYGDRLTSANATWRHYSTALPTPVPATPAATPTSPPWPFNGFTNIATWYLVTTNLQTGQFRPTMEILNDAKGPLPNFVWVKPPCVKASDHPGGTMGPRGPNWVGSVVNAIGNSSNWDSTVIFIIWDDWGGFYDHAIPPAPDPALERLERGVRIPFLVVSPYLAHPRGVVHTPGNPGSIMRFVDDLYGMKPLTEFDGQAPDLAGWFDFTQPPRSFVPIRGAENAGLWQDTWCNNSAMTIVD